MELHEISKEYCEYLLENIFCFPDFDEDNKFQLITPFVYPDRSNVEVFIEVKNNKIIISDLSVTFRKLDEIGIDVFTNDTLIDACKRIANDVKVTFTETSISKETTRDKLGKSINDIVYVIQSIYNIALFVK